MAVLCWRIRSLARISGQSGPPAVSWYWVGLEIECSVQASSLSRVRLIIRQGCSLGFADGQGCRLGSVAKWNCRLSSKVVQGHWLFSVKLCLIIGWGCWLACFPKWGNRMDSTVFLVLWPAFWSGHSGGYALQLRMTSNLVLCLGRIIEWAPQTVLSETREPNQVQWLTMLPCQMGSPPQLWTWAESLARISDRPLLPLEMPSGEIWDLVAVNLSSFSVSLWFPVVKLYRFPQWSP